MNFEWSDFCLKNARHVVKIWIKCFQFYLKKRKELIIEYIPCGVIFLNWQVWSFCLILIELYDKWVNNYLIKYTKRDENIIIFMVLCYRRSKSDDASKHSQLHILLKLQSKISLKTKKQINQFWHTEWCKLTSAMSFLDMLKMMC